VPNPSAPPPPVTPYLLYEDCAAAIAFLTRAFGFEVALRYRGREGDVTHAELRLPGGGTVFAGDPGDGYRNPARDGRITVAIHVYVDDVDSHHARARGAGAEIAEPPNDTPYGDRRYSALDPQGHQWYFAQHVRDVPPEAWGAAAG
jgi:PhnB protein